MAGYPLNLDNVPTVNPSGAPGGDFERIDARPEQFGALVGRSMEGLGGAIEKAGQTGFDVKLQQQEQLNKVDASDRLTKLTDIITDRHAEYSKLSGRDAMDKLPAYKAQIKQDYNDALENASNPSVKAHLAEAGGRQVDRYYSYGTEHAAREEKTFSKRTATDNLNGRINQAVNAYRQGDLASFRNEMVHAEHETRNVLELEGYSHEQIEPEIAKTRGKIYAYVTKMIMDDPRQGPANADEFFKAHSKEMDAGSQTAIDGMLRGARGKLISEGAAHEAIGNAAKVATPPGAAAPLPPGRFAPAVNDAIAKAAAATGVDEGRLRRYAQIESSGRPDAVTGSYKGLFQLSDAEFTRRGSGGDIFNPHDNALAAAQKLKAEDSDFQRRYGRPPTDADLYLIHNQGAGGYAAHMANPNAPAWQNMFSTGEGQMRGSKWAQDAIWGNIPDNPQGSPNFNKTMFPGGVATVTSADFMRGWTAKIGGTPAGPTNAEQKADAVRNVINNPTLNDDQRTHALHLVEQHFNAMEIASNTNAKIRKERSDQAADEWMNRIGKREFTNIVQDIQKDERMTWEARHTMSQFAAHVSGQPDSVDFGSGWLEAKKQVLAKPGDPKHISDPAEILRRALPGGDLTEAGARDILQTMQLAKRGIDEHGVQSSKASLLTYARSKLSFDQEMLFPGAPPLKDRRGEQIFNAQFVPKFNAAFADWTKNGKDPMQFLTQENVDKLMQGMRSPAQMKMDRLAATGEAAPAEAAGGPLWPTPEGVNPAAWVPLVAKPPLRADGTPVSQKTWGPILERLARNPTPETIKAFNESKLGEHYDAAKLVEKLGAKAASEGIEPEKVNLEVADKEMKLTPQERSLYERHLTNLKGPGGVDNPDGSRSTLFQMSFERDGKTYNIPTVWDGKILKPDDAIKRAEKIGLDKFPSYKDENEAEARYGQMHKFMERDTAAHLKKKAAPAPQIEPRTLYERHRAEVESLPHWVPPGPNTGRLPLAM